MARTPIAIATEDQEQAKLVTWMTKKGIKFYAIPNGGKRSLSEGLKFKRTGVQSGVPDLCIPVPSGSYHGLYIELKRVSGGKLSPNQVYWLSFLRDNGYYADVCYGCNEAIEVISRYIGLDK